MIENFLTDDEKIYRRTAGTTNEYGEKVDTWNLVTTIKGTIQPRGGSLGREESGILINYDAILYCLIGSNIRVGDKVLDKNNKYYDVLAVKDASNRHHHLEVLLKGNE